MSCQCVGVACVIQHLEVLEVTCIIIMIPVHLILTFNASCFGCENRIGVVLGMDTDQLELLQDHLNHNELGLVVLASHPPLKLI